MVSVQEKKLFNGCLEQIMLFEIKLILYVAAMIAGFRHEEYIFFSWFLECFACVEYRICPWFIEVAFLVAVTS